MSIVTPIACLSAGALLALGCAAQASAAAPLNTVMQSSVRSAQQMPQRLTNGAMEKATANALVAWTPYEHGYVLSPGEGKLGSNAVRCENPTGQGGYGVSQTLQLNRKVVAPLIVTGWSRAEGVAGTPSADYSVYVDIIYTDGTPLWGQTANFSRGTHGWERRTVTIAPAKPVRTLTVYALFRNTRGRVWFDDFEVREASPAQGDILYDGIPVRLVPQKALKPSSRTVRASTANGLSLALDQGSGRLTSLKVDGEEVAANGAPAGFFLRDVASGSDMVSLTGGTARSLGLALDAHVRATGNVIELSGAVRDRTGKDRAVTLYFSLPVDLRGGLWWDDIRRSRPIGQGEYANPISVGTGANGGMALYPFCCATNDRLGLAVGIDMNAPAQYRLAYNAAAKSLFIAFDLGLVPETKRFPSAAPFKFVIYLTDPAWGFRSAAAAYYQAFPSYFAMRSKDQGIWMPFTDVSTVQGWRDFGFKYHEGNNNVPFDDSAGILSFRYTEPMTYWMPMAKSVPRTYDGAMSVVNDALRSGPPDRRRWAEAVITSGTQDEHGRYNLEIQNAPWTDGAVFVLNPNPNLSGANTKATLSWGPEIAQSLYGPEANGTLDGEYLDSLEGWATYRNFRRSHFASVSVPLTFSTDTHRPCILEVMSTFEFARWMAEGVHRRGKLMFANAVPWRFPFLACVLDVMGTETNWFPGPNWQPEGDPIFCLRRTTCYQKPYLLLMNTDYDRMTPQYVEEYFRRCLFYGVYPSMFSHNAAENPYWQNPAWYNRDRPLFKEYIPLIKQVAEAGWQPITGARSRDPNVYLERFGPDASGRIYLTAMNTSDRPIDTVVTTHPKDLGAVYGPDVEKLYGDADLAFVLSSVQFGAALHIGPHEVAVFALPRSSWQPSPLPE